LWCGIARNDELTRLQKQIERALTSKAGVPPEERKFSPHITIARLNESPDKKLAQFLVTSALFETEEFMVSGFTLYSSALKRDGAVYERVAEYGMNLCGHFSDIIGHSYDKNFREDIGYAPQVEAPE